MVKAIKLGEHKILIDDWNYERVKSCKWRLTGKNKDIIMTNDLYSKPTLGRFIMKYTGPLTIDHKDRDLWNNLENNLRIATESQQQANRGPKMGKKFKGVSFHKRDGKFQALLEKDSKAYFGGYFDSENQAARAYDKLALKHFGEFAYLNFPKELSCQH